MLHVISDSKASRCHSGYCHLVTQHKTLHCVVYIASPSFLRYAYYHAVNFCALRNSLVYLLTRSATIPSGACWSCLYGESSVCSSQNVCRPHSACTLRYNSSINVFLVRHLILSSILDNASVRPNGCRIRGAGSTPARPRVTMNYRCLDIGPDARFVDFISTSSPV